MCDEDIFNFEEEPSASTSYNGNYSGVIANSNRGGMCASAPPLSPEGVRKSYSAERNLAMEQLARKLSVLDKEELESAHPSVPVIMRPRAETISTLPTFRERDEFFQPNFMSLNTSRFFGMYESSREEDDDDDDMECEDSYPDRPFSLNFRPDFNIPYNQAGSCDPSPAGEHDHIPFMMSGIQPECYKMNSLKRRTNDKLSNSPYPLPGQECNDISKRSRSARSSPPYVLFSHLSQSAPR